VVEKEEKKPALYVSLEIPETRVRIDIPQEVMKKMVGGNPNREEAVQACVVGTWASGWSKAVTGMTPEEAEKRGLKEYHENIRKRLCKRLYEALLP